MTRSRLTFAILVATIALTLWAHVAMSLAGFQIHLGNRKAAGFLMSTLLAQPSAFAMIAGQLLVFLFLLLAFFGTVIILARQRRPSLLWWEKEPSLLLLVWFAISWLLLRWHFVLFPRSVWSWLTEPLFLNPGSRFLDVLCGALVLWRLILLSHDVGARAAILFRVYVSLRFPYKALAGAAVLVILITSFANLDAKDADRRDANGSASSVRSELGNVIVIGLDSVRRDVFLSANKKVLPNLYELRERGFVNANVVTPLARTFPAWVTILTGAHPASSGARDNHAPQRNISRQQSVAWDFRRASYRTIYATDETRFSHILPEFGFDEVVGPQKGVSDFLLGQFGDQPLVNLLIQVPYAELLLPALVGNRAFAHAYRPRSFVKKLARSIGHAKSQRTFMAIHLCTAHWPYFVADSWGRPAEEQSGLSVTDASYRQMLLKLDQQLGELLRELRLLGYFDEESLVVILADHGEGLPSDWIPHPKVVSHAHGALVSQSIGGHGTSLVNPHEWRVFTLFLGRTPSGPVLPGRSDALSSLEDVAPKLRQLLAQRARDANGGKSVESLGFSPRPYVRLETGWRPQGFNVANPDGSQALRIAEASYNVMPDGRMEMKDEAYAESIANKDLGLTDGRHSLLLLRKRDSDLLVSQDLNANVWEVFPPSRSSAETSGASLPFISEACKLAEIRHRLNDWCD